MTPLTTPPTATELLNGALLFEVWMGLGPTNTVSVLVCRDVVVLVDVVLVVTVFVNVVLTDCVVGRPPGLVAEVEVDVGMGEETLKAANPTEGGEARKTEYTFFCRRSCACICLSKQLAGYGHDRNEATHQKRIPYDPLCGRVRQDIQRIDRANADAAAQVHREVIVADGICGPAKGQTNVRRHAAG
jgi:hypothetical protein